MIATYFMAYGIPVIGLTLLTYAVYLTVDLWSDINSTWRI